MTQDALSRTFSALADPTRRAMLRQLSRGETSVKELARPYKISLPAISRHLKVLERAGLITRARRAQWRPCRMESAKMTEAMGWMEECRKEWELRFDRLDAFLKDLKENDRNAPPPEA
jgi:DNA-binding transcriptional ArsR family regulator